MFITWSNFFFIIIWGGICDVWRIDKNIEDLTINGIRKVIGNGKSTCFWEDTWIGDKSLRVQFSRLYSMSLQQRTTIDECGIWDGALWLWNLQWRREFFQWELQLVVALQNLLDQVTIVEDLQDRVWWSYHSSGCFSVKAFHHKYHDAQMHILQYDTSVSKVWHGLCPPKAELLVWLRLLGRINTKDRLQRLSVLQNNDLRCVLCNSCDETIAHLFFTCEYTWRVWSFCCNWWGVTWVQSVCPRMNFESWSVVGLKGDQRKA